MYLTVAPPMETTQRKQLQPTPFQRISILYKNVETKSVWKICPSLLTFICFHFRITLLSKKDFESEEGLTPSTYIPLWKHSSYFFPICSKCLQLKIRKPPLSEDRGNCVVTCYKFFTSGNTHSVK